MENSFRAKAAALRKAAANPHTDPQLGGLMMDTAADMEAMDKTIEADNFSHNRRHARVYNDAQPLYSMLDRALTTGQQTDRDGKLAA